MDDIFIFIAVFNSCERCPNGVDQMLVIPSLVDSIDRAGFEFRFTVTHDMKKNENHRKGNTFDISRFYSRKSTEGCRDQIDAVLDHKRGNECYAANGEVNSTLLRLTQNSEL